MNELEKLMKQKKEIEEKIRILKHQSVSNGFAKVDVEHYPTDKPDRHFLAVYYKPLGDGRAKWQTIYSATSRQEVVDAIPGILANMQSLYDSLTNSGESKTSKAFDAEDKRRLVFCDVKRCAHNEDGKCANEWQAGCGVIAIHENEAGYIVCTDFEEPIEEEP